MFRNCKEIELLDLSNCDTSNITNMAGMFSGCTGLTAIIGLDRFVTDNVEDMDGMFELCCEIEYLNLSNFHTSNVIKMPGMFNKCINYFINIINYILSYLFIKNKLHHI